MIKDVLQNVGGVGIYGVISVLIFFSVFLGVLVWAFSLRKPYLDAVSEIPLRNDGEPSDALDVNLDKEQNHD